MSQRDKKRCPGQEYMPMEQLQAIVLERIRHHISGYLALEKPDKDLMDLRTENKQRAKQSELERLRNEIQRRRKAMQELYLDKSSGIVESAQFVELNQTFLDDIEELSKRCSRLEKELEEVVDIGLQRAKLERYWEDIRKVETLSRGLACLMIEKVVVYPYDNIANTRKVEIDWKF